MQMQATAGYAGGQIPNPYMAYGAPVGFAPAPLTDEASVYLPTGPGEGDAPDADRPLPDLRCVVTVFLTLITEVNYNSIP